MRVLRGFSIFLVNVNNLNLYKLGLLHFSIIKILRSMISVMCRERSIILIFDTNA